MADLEDRLAAGKAMADEAWAQTLRAMYEGGSLLYGDPGDHDPSCESFFVEGAYAYTECRCAERREDWLDRRDQARQEREDTAREEAEQ